MRIGRNKFLGLIGATAFFVVLLVNAPAALLTPVVKSVSPGVSYTMISGTLWNARISGLQAEGIYLGDVSADINLLRLFTVALSYEIEVKGQTVNGQALFSKSLFGRVEIRDADFTISRALLRRYALLGVQVDGGATISGGTIVINDKGCVSAEGMVRTDALSSVAKRFGLGAFDLEGPVRCVDGRMSLQLAGAQNDIDAISVTLTELTDYRYRMAVIIETPDAALKQALQLAGFEDDGDSVTYEEIANWITPSEADDVQHNAQPDTGA